MLGEMSEPDSLSAFAITAHHGDALSVADRRQLGDALPHRAEWSPAPVMIEKLNLLPVVHLPRHQQPGTGLPPPGLGHHRIQPLVAPSQFELQWAGDDLIGVDHQPQRVVGPSQRWFSAGTSRLSELTLLRCIGRLKRRSRAALPE